VNRSHLDALVSREEKKLAETGHAANAPVSHGGGRPVFAVNDLERLTETGSKLDER
jgi:hypothetical protein